MALKTIRFVQGLSRTPLLFVSSISHSHMFRTCFCKTDKKIGNPKSGNLEIQTTRFTDKCPDNFRGGGVAWGMGMDLRFCGFGWYGNGYVCLCCKRSGDGGRRVRGDLAKVWQTRGSSTNDKGVRDARRATVALGAGSLDLGLYSI